MKYLLTESAKHLKIKSVKVERKHHPDGEVYIRVLEDLKGKSLVIVSNVTPTNLHKLLFTVDAVKHAGGRIRKLVIPYLSYARQDQVYERGEAAAGCVICNVLRSLRIPVEIYDIHNMKLRKDLSFTHKSVLPLLAAKLPKKMMVVSPDKGGVKRAKEIAKLLKAPMAVISKKRQGRVKSMVLTGEVKGKNVVIVEDMISTGGTLVKAAQVLKRKGAKEVYCVAAHGLFVGNAREKLKKSGIKKIIVSNTLRVTPSRQIEVVKIEKLILGKKN